MKIKAVAPTDLISFFFKTTPTVYTVKNSRHRLPFRDYHF